MNIGNLFNTSGLSLPTDGPGAPPSAEGDAAAFGQALEAATAGGQTLPVAAMLSPASPSNWPAAWLKIFGQNLPTTDPALDLLQEAPTPTGNSPELSVTLTELMAALQPVVNQSSVTLPTTEEMSDLPADHKANAESDATELVTLSGAALIQPAVVFSPPPAAEVTLTPGNSAVTNVPLNGKGITTPEMSSFRQLPAAASMPAGEQSELSSALAGAASLDAVAQPAASFAQELAQQAPPTLEGAETERSPLPAAGSETNRVSQPKVETPLEDPKPVLPPISTTPAVVTGEVKATTTPAAPNGGQLPEIPALHQIVEKMSLMSRQGETEVRLQLHPESLGQVLIQLNVSRGEMSVRMLVETAQAQSLIQEHLPQLKAAFSTQGLQLDNLAVNIGSDASAFDMQRRQPGEWSQRLAQPQSFGPSGEVKPAVTPQPVSRTGGSLYRVDYQV